MKYIELTKGYIAVVDDEDYGDLSCHLWTAHRTNRRYTSYVSAVRGEDNKLLYMHRVIANAPVDKEVDHINGISLDNRRSNLRICNHKSNAANKRLPRTNKSGYKGVHRHRNKWMVTIGNNRKTEYLGVYENPVEAAKVWDKRALELHGEYARTNKSLGLY